jgi:formylglycine-generating enzyme required for sulfatase activity
MPPAVLDRAFFRDLFLQTEAAEFLIEHPKTGMLMVLVPAGKLLIAGPGPPFKVDLSAYYVSVHPVTNAQYARFVAETGHRTPELPTYFKHRESVWKNGQFPPEMANHPVTNVSWEDATDYCCWANLRLPTELEWLKAARGLDGRAYPLGKKMDPSRCGNYSYKGNETTDGVWRYGHGGAPFGGLQFNGNVSEWCADWYDEWHDWYTDDLLALYRRGNLLGPSTGSYRVTRNGRSRLPGRSSSAHLGFRCVCGLYTSC